ncbi:hypothetical protein [Desulfobacter sp.]|uniref:hypothetical protein n=1 Tax=Desulfobacter sp. TaxID=2294 RepID=UPI003D129B11
MVKDRSGWLNGWKAIAEYCGDLAVKTVQNYEKHKGLPVKRIGRKVVALPVALDRWLEKNPQ